MLGMTNSKLNNYQEGYDAGYSKGKTVGAASMFSECTFNWANPNALQPLSRVITPLTQAEIDADVAKYPHLEGKISLNDIYVGAINVTMASAKCEGRVLFQYIPTTSKSSNYYLGVFDLSRRGCIFDYECRPGSSSGSLTSYEFGAKSAALNDLVSDTMYYNQTLELYVYKTMGLHATVWIISHIEPSGSVEGAESLASDFIVSVKNASNFSAYYYNTSGILTPALR